LQFYNASEIYSYQNESKLSVGLALYLFIIREHCNKKKLQLERGGEKEEEKGRQQNEIHFN
jgi:hypothetical protein